MVRSPPDQWDERTDVVVIGSGTGLAAALAAADAGAAVRLLEKAPVVGGTTAVSGGGSWAPNSRAVVASVGETPREDLLEYLEWNTGGRTPRAKLERYVDLLPAVFEFIETETALRFVHADGLPDYHPDRTGASVRGRMIVPERYDGDRLGADLEAVRRSPHYPLPVTYEEIEAVGGSNVFPTRGDFDELADRMAENLLAGGTALVAGLYEACLERGVTVDRSTPGIELVVDDGTVAGVVAERDGESWLLGADAVIIAAGGLEWDAEMREQFLRGPLTAPASPPYNEGDGIEMGAEVGAKLGNMDEAFWFPTVEVPGETWEDGSQLYRIPKDRILPGAIVVNEDGDRFVSESVNYNDITRAFHEFDPVAFDHANLPAYQIVDQDFRETYAIANQVLPADDLPGWVWQGESLRALADKLGVDPDGLEATVERYNEDAREGVDTRFHSGDSAYGRAMGDPDAPHPNLAPLDRAPYYAVELLPGAVGTKGGLVTSVDSEVLDWDGEAIPGLYAASNSTAHVMGLGYAGGGATIGPNLVFGYVAGRRAAGASL